jgi:hypothetical protein
VTDTAYDSEAGPGDGVEFGLEYDGPALVAHEMDVRYLAPALLSAATLFRTVNRLARPGDPEIAVNIKATSEGSFLVQLVLWYDLGRSVLASPATTGAEGLLTLVVSIIGLRRMRQQKGESASTTPLDSGYLRLQWPDGTILEVTPDALRLLDQPAVIKPMSEMVRPVAESGIDNMRIRRAGRVLSEVTTDDLPAFDEFLTPDREILSDSEREVYLVIRNAVFDPSLTWRFNDGSNNLSAHVTDPEFNERVANGSETFGNGGMLRCMLRSVQWRDPAGKIHSEVEVVRVLEHLPPSAGQPTLFSED